MPWRPRVQYEGAIYPVMDRGGRREPIVQTEADHVLWLYMGAWRTARNSVVALDGAA